MSGKKWIAEIFINISFWLIKKDLKHKILLILGDNLREKEKILNKLLKPYNKLNFKEGFFFFLFFTIFL